MKKRVLFGFFAFLLLNIIIIYGVEADTITGKATSQPINISIFVLPSYPVLQILKPENETYLRNYSLLLNFSASNYQSIWYNLDNGNNITITSPTYFNASDGQHTLYLFANSTTGLITQKNVTFFVNSTKLIIIYTEYNKSIQTTDFYSYSYEDLQELLSAMLHNEYGKISFNEVIDVIADENPFDNIVDFDASTNISFNRIEVNITAMPNLNKSAILSLYNLSFVNPRILRDGETCPSSICKIISYSSGTLVFNVTGFSVYSAEETPIAAEEKAAKIFPLLNFTTDKTSIKVSLFSGETAKEEIKIINTGRSALEIKLDAGHLNRFVIFSENPVLLKPGEIKTISIIIKATNEIPFLYIGSLTISSERLKKEIPFIIRIKSREGLGISANIINKELCAGQELKANISISKDPKLKQELEAIYTITDKNNKTILTEKEHLIIYDKIEFVKAFSIPQETPAGKYILYAKISQDLLKAEDADVFYIIEIEKPRPKNYIYLILLMFVIALIILIILRKKRKEQNIEKGEIEKKLKRIKVKLILD